MSEMEIDWSGASFESGEDERARREREAMEALNARLAERDAQRGLVPTSEAVFPPDLMPPAQAPQRPLPAPPGMLAAPTPGDLGPSSPPPNPSPLDPGPPAISTSPQPPEPTAEASTNPEAQTSTAGAQAANLRQQAQQQPAPGSVDELMAQERRRMEQEQALQRPTSVHSQPPTAAMPGPTGLPSTRTAPLAPISGQTGIETGAAPAMAAMQAQRDEPSFDERREMAREEDVRRRRIRGILTGLAALMGMGTINSGGSMGGALPGLIAAGMVRRPDEEETLLEGDERSREIGAQEAEQASVAQRLRLAQEEAEREERARQERLLFDYRKLQGDQEDRSMRTGIQLRENEREEELLQPESAVSARERAALRSSLANQPREVQQAYPSEMLDGLSATELRSIRDQLERGGRARTIAGSGRGSSGVSGGLQGVENAPAAFIAGQAQINGDNPQNPSAESIQAANIQWNNMSRSQRARWSTTPDAQRLAQVVGRRLPGYEAAAGGAISQEQHDEARQALLDQQEFDASINQAVEAAERIEGMSAGEQALARGGDLVGVEVDDAVSDFNDARTSIISTMNRMAGGGTMDQAEFTRWQQQLPAISDFRSIAGATRRLRAAQRRVAELTQARVQSAGYRRAEGDQQQPAQRQRRQVFGPYTVVNDAGDTRQTRTFTTQEAANAALARLEREAGYRRVRSAQ